MPAEFVEYKHGIKVLNETPTGEAGLALDENMIAIANLFDTVNVIESVNGQVGDVVLTASSVGALPVSGGAMTGAFVPRTLMNLTTAGTDGEIARFGNSMYSYSSAGSGGWRRLGARYVGSFV